MQRENFNSKAEQMILVGVYLLAEGEKKELSPTVTELRVLQAKLLPNPTFYNQAPKNATLLMRSPQLLLHPGAPAVTSLPRKAAQEGPGSQQSPRSKRTALQI